MQTSLTLRMMPIYVTTITSPRRWEENLASLLMEQSLKGKMGDCTSVIKTSQNFHFEGAFADRKKLPVFSIVLHFRVAL